ncbi:MAG: hypothetical protein ACR2M2_03865 [Gaiellaceae bacterium]
MEKRTRTRLVAGSAVALVLAVALGASAAIAGSRALGSNDDGQAVIDDAAAELGVEPSALEDALEHGLKNRVQEAIDAGALTEEQGADLEKRIESGETPFLGGFGRFGGFGAFCDHRRQGHVGHFAGLDAAASYLGLTLDELHERRRDGTTLAAIAKDEGKSVDGLVRAMVDAAKKELAAAVAADRLTGERADAIEQNLEERTTDLVNGELRLGPFGPNRHFGGGFRRHGESRFFSGPRR